MFEKTRELLESGIENESGFCEFELDNKKREDIQSLLTHLDDLSKKAEYMKIGWNFDERYTDKYKYSIDIYDNDGQLSYEVDANTYEQALSETVKSLEKESKNDESERQYRN